MRRHAWLSLTAVSVTALLAATSGALAATLTIGVGDTPGPIDLSSYVGGPYDGLDNSGYVDGGSSTGVYSDHDLTTVHNQASGTVRADNAGESFVVDGDVGTFINDGSVEGGHNSNIGIGGHTGTFINNGFLNVSQDSSGGGVYFGDGVDSFTNGADGVIGIGSGVVSYGDVGSFTNLGAIDATEWGVALFDMDGGAHITIGQFNNAGSINGSDIGVFTANSTITSFINSGGISGGTAVQFGYTYVDHGTTPATTYEYPSSVTSFANTATGEITGSQFGVDVFGDVGTFSNAGAIRATSGRGVNIDGDVTGTFRNASGGSISGDTIGVSATGDVNAFVNEYGASIEGGSGVIFQTGSTVRSFANAGTITGTGFGVDFDGSVDDFFNSGRVEGPADGVVAVGTVGNFTNSGTITDNAGGHDGVEFRSAVTGAFRNAAGGSISGTYEGVLFWGGASAFANEAGATISGGTDGVYIDAPVGTFSNAGDVSGGSFGANFRASGTTDSFRNEATGRIWASDSSSAQIGVAFLGDVGDFFNAGQIWATDDFDSSNGVQFEGLVDRVFNSGTVSGSNVGFLFDYQSSPGTVVNAGQVSGPYGGITFVNTVDAFINTASGSIWANNDFYGALQFYGNAGSVENDGLIADDIGLGGSISFNDPNGYNPPRINVGAFRNGGTLRGTDLSVVANNVAFGSFINSGTISADYPGYGTAVFLMDSEVTTFTNRASGIITGAKTGVDGSQNSMIESLTNAGYIRGTTYAGVALYGDTADGTTFVNSGTIEGDTGVLYLAEDNGKEQFTNSGTIRSLSGGYAIDFDCGCGTYDRADTLTLQTGSKIFGAVRFTNEDYNSDALDSHDTLDFSGFAGNTLLKVPGLDAVTPGSRGYVWDKPNERIAIFDLSGLGAGAIGQSWTDIGAAMFAFSQGQMDDGSALDPGSTEPLGFAPPAPKTSAERATETAVMTELDTRQHLGVHGWASVIGGGSGGPGALDRLSLYGGVVAGSHARLSSMLTLGGMGGLVQATSSSLNGDEVLNSTTGSLGLYGSAQFGVADVDFSLLAGVSGNQSNRKVVAGGTTETAAGNFLSGVVSPMLAVSVPVLSMDGTTVSLTGSGSYTAGLVAGYSETGSSMNLTVGSQTIQVVDARIGLATKLLIASADGGAYSLTTKAGVFATSNFGSSSVPVTVLGQTTQLNTPGSTAYGVYTGVGVEGAITQTLHLGLTLDNSWRTDSIGSASAKVTVGGVF